jgi:DNA-binding transcriptional regulator YiaG
MDGSFAMIAPYQYTATGLDWVYLQNGYTLHDTHYGSGVSIQNADRLHALIAHHIVTSPAKLRGQEVRFLRDLLDLSQEALGRCIGASRGSVARWEGKRNEAIPGTADRGVRMFYALKADGHEIAERLVSLLRELDEMEHQASVAEFKATKNGWVAAKAA